MENGPFTDDFYLLKTYGNVVVFHSCHSYVRLFEGIWIGQRRRDISGQS